MLKYVYIRVYVLTYGNLHVSNILSRVRHKLKRFFCLKLIYVHASLLKNNRNVYVHASLLKKYPCYVARHINHSITLQWSLLSITFRKERYTNKCYNICPNCLLCVWLLSRLSEKSSGYVQFSIFMTQLFLVCKKTHQSILSPLCVWSTPCSRGRARII